jgi:formylglycine-generating enzyme required for sulfatase activity
MNPLGRRSFIVRAGALLATLPAGCAKWTDLGWDKEKDRATLQAIERAGAREQARPPAAVAADRVLRLPNGATLSLVHVPAGRFVMGSPASEPDRNPDERQHDVALTRPFWLGRTEVTQAQWTAVMSRTIRDQRALAQAERAGLPDAEQALWGEGPQHPIYYVSWDEAAEFCRRVNALESEQGRMPAGYGCWLPTEAQWEYACRAGSTGPHGAGAAFDDMAWYERNAGGVTHPVATKTPNAWGLFDMQGNVGEWCADYYGEYPAGPAIDPLGADAGKDRVERGGRWANPEKWCRAAQRNGVPGNRRYPSLGFRLALRPMG